MSAPYQAVSVRGTGCDFTFLELGLSTGASYYALMLARWFPYAAHALTALRVALTPLFVFAVCAAPQQLLWGVVAVLVFGVVAASDVWDGRVARRFNSSSHGGRVFDLFADIAFLLPALATYVHLGLLPWWVPAAIGAAFLFFVVDSGLLWPAPAPPAVPSSIDSPLIWLIARIGHIGGVSNFVLVGVLVCNNSARIQLLSPGLLSILYLLVPLYSAAAIAARLAVRRHAGLSQASVPSPG